MEIWIAWAMIALFLAIIELFLPGLTVICLSVGAIFSAIGAALQLSLHWQLVIFCITSLVCFIFIRPVLLSLFSSKDGKHETNVHALIGKKGVVIEDIKDGNMHGWIRVEQEDWPAMSSMGNLLPKDTHVVIKSIEGNTLFVEGV